MKKATLHINEVETIINSRENSLTLAEITKEFKKNNQNLNVSNQLFIIL